ncbi:MAG: xanthine dehydrogenase family protein molybdopterin-binding subunit, partial [Pseudomonadota bacterium]
MTDQEKEFYYVEGLPIPETPRPGESPRPWKGTRIIGKAIPRVDAYERVSGSAIYPSDVSLPNMLYGAILRCPHPHARVKKIETGRARSMPGVHAVISAQTPAANVPWIYSSSGIRMKSKLFDPHCRFEGETIAAAAAETSYLAWDAVRAIDVAYEVLPNLSDE